MRRVFVVGTIVLFSALGAMAQEISPTMAEYLRVKPGEIVLRHVRMIDGTGRVRLKIRM